MSLSDPTPLPSANLILTQEQIDLLDRETGPIRLRNAEGRIVGYLVDGQLSLRRDLMYKQLHIQMEDFTIVSDERSKRFQAKVLERFPDDGPKRQLTYDEVADVSDEINAELDREDDSEGSGAAA